MPLLKKPRAQEKRAVVHLGNYFDIGVANGEVGFASKTRKYAERFPETRFVGIDIQKLKSDLPNWKQIEAEFISGLKKMPDNSVDIISSEMGLGYYSSNVQYAKWLTQRTKLMKRELYTAEVMRLAAKKLKQGGKLMVAVDEIVLPTIRRALAEAGFGESKTKIYELKDIERERTYNFRNPVFAKLKIFQVIARK
ncbi:MAG: class I SAM-dependent methyltransferase [archaeon]